MTFTKSPKEYLVICCHEIAKKVFHPINSNNTTFSFDKSKILSTTFDKARHSDKPTSRQMIQSLMSNMSIMCLLLRQVFIETFIHGVAVHLGVKMADTLSFTAKVDMVDF